MPNIHKVQEPPKMTVEKPTGLLRLVEDRIGERTLQQEVRIEEHSGGGIVGFEKEWRDVPIVSAEQI